MVIALAHPVACEAVPIVLHDHAHIHTHIIIEMKIKKKKLNFFYKMNHK